MINPPDIKLEILKSRLSAVRDLAGECRLCPRGCGVDRGRGDLGICGIGGTPMVSSVNLHHGEEPPISGSRGSGTIFMTGCNLSCIFCQNYPISQLRHGVEISIDGLASKMLWLQSQSAHNINFVTPTPQAHFLFEALIAACRDGLAIPIVYNTGGFDSLEMLRLWEGIIDIYMPDMKYSDNINAKKYSNAPDYVSNNRAAIKEMYRQVGDLRIDDDGIATRGLLIRHLVLPGGLSGSEQVLKFIAENISHNTYIGLMSQYFPAWKAVDHKLVSRRLEREEYRTVVRLLRKYGLENGWTQPY